MTQRIEKHQLSIAPSLYNFCEQELLPDLAIDSDLFWQGVANIVHGLSDENQRLLAKREALQQQIDVWHQANPAPIDMRNYRNFLTNIGYIVPEGEAFSISTDNVDSEIERQAGAQLVVPVMNARFALNACNARWGSLYDALYGTDVISADGGAEAGEGYNPVRGARVVEYAKSLLDSVTPLDKGSHQQAVQYTVTERGLSVTLQDGSQQSLMDCTQFIGYQGEALNPSAILVKNNNLHIIICIDENHPVGKTDLASVCDVIMEAALTTIMDCEDSVAAVDSEDKVSVYRNWLGLMRGTLTETFRKDGKDVTRRMHADKYFTTAEGNEVVLPGRSLLFVRNVGHLMTNNAILDVKGNEVPEGILDAIFTSTAALYDLRKKGAYQNSRTGSVYIVKPKMHGPEEVELSCHLFAQVESLLGIAENTIKIGIMDEERRTTVNLKECIRMAQQRVVFINTGFLDRTGDEIHTSMHAGVFIPKTKMKQQLWLNAYEQWNVEIGLACGLPGRAQIGKGMWAMPDEMAAMMQQKIAHPQSGANTAWVPSPNGATLHSIHYHQVDVAKQQQLLTATKSVELDSILTIPLLNEALSAEDIQREIDNNTQSILGYVVRWIDQGIGCSKVPDINGIGLMEDRATLRISSQLLSNWLLHQQCSVEQVMQSLRQMALVVDEQNQHDSFYTPIAPNYDGLAFNAACDLIFKGATQPSGYTEPLLHSYRLKKKTNEKGN